jgi:hypothetical protein
MIMLRVFLEVLKGWAVGGAFMGFVLGMPVVLYALWGRLRGING